MDRRTLLTAAVASAAIGSARQADAAGDGRENIEPGCEGAVAALKGWIAALSNRDFAYLERHLSDDFIFSAHGFTKCRDKAAFIETDRHIYNAKINFLRLTAQRLGDLVITVVFAHAMEEFRGDLGSDMPSAEQMNSTMRDGATLGYASGWREIDGVWKCTSHHVLGQVKTA
jgi:hypothetical protein